MGIRRGAVLLVLGVYVLFILDLAWLQFPSHHPAPNIVPLRSIIGDWRTGGRGWIVNFLGNIAAFIPIGMIPALARPGRLRARHAALFSLSVSAMIEVVQYFSGRRVADVDDLILNTAGGVLGYCILRMTFARRSRPSDGEKRRPAGGVSTDPGGPS
jgi:glycopeptide antibiotics resistance protein